MKIIKWPGKGYLSVVEDSRKRIIDVEFLDHTEKVLKFGDEISARLFLLYLEYQSWVEPTAMVIEKYVERKMKRKRRVRDKYGNLVDPSTIRPEDRVKRTRKKTSAKKVEATPEKPGVQPKRELLKK